MNNPAQIDSPLTPPSLMKSLTAGFDAISNHAWLVVFTLLLDAVLWLGPRLRIDTLFQEMFLMPEMLEAIGNAELIDSMRETIKGFNLLSLMRTFPIGVPSLMVGRAPLQSPLGEPYGIDINTISSVLILWALLSLFGLIIGALYFNLVAQVVVDGSVLWQNLLSQFPKNLLQIIILTFSLILLLMIFSLPISCMMSFVLLSGVGLEQVTFLLVMVMVVIYMWFLIPLFFSPHAIILNHQKAWGGIKNSFRVSRKTLPNSFIFVIIIVLFSEGMSFLWNIPPDNSWLTLVGILGHAFITTSLLAATFFYFRDANQWVLQTKGETSVSNKKTA